MFGQTSLNHVCNNSNFSIVKGDIRIESVVAPLMKKADIIIPLAALVGAPLCTLDPIGATTINHDAITMMIKLLAKDQKVLMPTTNSAYGTLAFYTMNATTLAERMRITPAGVVAIGGQTNTFIDYTTNTARFYGGSSTNTFGLGAANTIYYQGDASQFYPTADNTRSLGIASFRYTTVYATTGSINTSDYNDKEQIENLTELEKNVAIKLKGLIKKFKFKDAVNLKGDKARIHIGVIAQEVEQAFIEEGLDANKYGMFCSDTWYEIDGITVDKNTEGAIEKTKLGVRYEELMTFIISQI
jgi:hypothetical protein